MSLATAEPRRQILDTRLRQVFLNIRDRGVYPFGEVEPFGEVPSWVACSSCGQATEDRPVPTRWLLDGAIMVCLECGADCT